MSPEDVEVIAQGPPFSRGDNRSTQRRAVFLKQSSKRAGEVVYVVAIEVAHVESDSKPRLSKRVVTRSYTLASRLFCDYVLEQALADDAGSEDPEPTKPRRRSGQR